MLGLVFNVSFCCDHYKGGDRINQLPGQEHAEWLEEQIDLLQRICAHPILVSMTGFRGWPEVETSQSNRERDVLWRIFARPNVRLVTMAANPGHQAGAAWCIRLGLEAAGKLDYDCLIHTAEDVVPNQGAFERMKSLLEKGYEYVGERWGVNQDEANAQFFGCRVPRLAGLFDPGKLGEYGHIERYLRSLLLDGMCCWTDSLYRSTHDHTTWRRWADELLVKGEK